MATIAELQDLRDKLVKIRASGAREIEYENRRIAYKSDDEIATAIQDLDRRIQQLGGSQSVRSVYLNFSKGV